MAAADETANLSAEAKYHYWHDKVARGEEAAPFPEPKLIEAVPKPEGTLPEKTITDFGFMDDDDEGQIKLYIKLEGDLESVTKDDVDLKVESRWGNASMTASLKGQKFMHVLGAEKLMHDVIPEECKVKVLTKKQKCVIVLQKRGDPKMPWEDLRQKVALPYRRGGGG